MSITVIGSSNTDMIIRVPRIPRPGETVIGAEFSTAAGGKGANQAVAAAKAGGKVAFIACIGDDIYGSRAAEGFRKLDIDLKNLIIDPAKPSGVAMIYVDEHGENTIAVAPGANSSLLPSEIEKARTSIESSRILLLQLETPVETVRAALLIARQKDVLTILNPAPARKLDDQLLSMVDILTPNETEAELISGITVRGLNSAEQAGKVLLEMGVKTVILTMGSNGALLVNHQESTLIQGFKVKALDTTAAGDTFNGALATALTEGMEIKTAIRFANAAAAISVTRIGAQPSAPDREEIDRMLNGLF